MKSFFNVTNELTHSCLIKVININMDPNVNMKQLREQVDKERKARRNYSKKWSGLAVAENYKFYKPNEISRQLKEQLKLENLCPYVYNNEGECFFISPQMYDKLLAKCRCGRARTEAHMLKCLQKTFNAKDENNEKVEKVPETSNGVIGWHQENSESKRRQQSMRYISPIQTMLGPKITVPSYEILNIA